MFSVPGNCGAICQLFTPLVEIVSLHRKEEENRPFPSCCEPHCESEAMCKN